MYNSPAVLLSGPGWGRGKRGAHSPPQTSQVEKSGQGGKKGEEREGSRVGARLSLHSLSGIEATKKIFQKIRGGVFNGCFMVYGMEEQARKRERLMIFLPVFSSFAKIWVARLRQLRHLSPHVHFCVSTPGRCCYAAFFFC